MQKLTRVEITEFFHYVNEFCRMNSGAEVVDAWASQFGERYTKQNLIEAFTRLQKVSDKPPTIYSMQEQLNGMLGRTHGHAQSQRPAIDAKPTRLEVCIDKLGYAEVEKNLREIIPPSQPFSWSQLLLNKEYKAAFARKLSEMSDFCVAEFGVDEKSVLDKEVQ